MKNSYVSIIIPAYNAEQFIEETLKSVLKQSYKNFEVIVINDGSVDRTNEVVNDFLVKDSRVQLLEQPHLGTAAARNLGIKTSRGELIAFLDADDLWHQEKLSEQVLLLSEKPFVGIVSCLAVIIDEDSNSKGLISGRRLEGFCYRQMLEAGGISGGSIVLVHKKCLEKVGYFDSKLEPYEDWDMWIRLTKLFSVRTVPKVLVGYRRSKNCASRNYERLMNSGELVLKKAFANDQNLSKKYYDLCFTRDVLGIGAWCFIDKQYTEARDFVKKAFSISPAACLTDYQRLGFLILLVLSSLIPKNLFERLFMKILLPKIFGLKFGESFMQLRSRHL